MYIVFAVNLLLIPEIIKHNQNYRQIEYIIQSSFMTHSSDAVPSNSAEEELENWTELDFFLPVIDTVPSYIDRRFNAECLSVLKHISSLVATGDNFDNAVGQLCSIAKLGGIYVLQKATCCSTMSMRHTDPLIVRWCPCPAFNVCIHDGNFETQSVVQASTSTNW